MQWLILLSYRWEVLGKGLDQENKHLIILSCSKVETWLNQMKAKGH